jgi:hypothetical protein
MAMRHIGNIARHGCVLGTERPSFQFRNLFHPQRPLPLSISAQTL